MFSCSIINTNIQTDTMKTFKHVCSHTPSLPHTHTTPPINRNPSLLHLSFSCSCSSWDCKHSLANGHFRPEHAPHSETFYSLKVLKCNTCKKGFSAHGNRALTLANAGEGEKGAFQSCIYAHSYKQDAGSGASLSLHNDATEQGSTTEPTCFQLPMSTRPHCYACSRKRNQLKSGYRLLQD